MIDLRATHGGRASGSAGRGPSPLWLIRSWGEFAVAAVIALVRMVAGKDQRPEVITAPPEAEDIFEDDYEAIEDTDCDP